MYFPYIRDILRKTTQPHRASWLIWSVLGLIAFFSQYAEGATDSLWMTGAQTLGTVVVLALSLKFGTEGFSALDRISLLAAIFGVVWWYFTRNAVYALLITIAVDVISAGLTAKKAYALPESETMSTWILSATSSVFGTLAVGSFNPVLMVYPFYVFLASSGVILAIIFGRRKAIRSYAGV